MKMLNVCQSPLPLLMPVIIHILHNVCNIQAFILLFYLLTEKITKTFSLHTTSLFPNFKVMLLL